jgi:hypothetical protein
MKSLTLSNRKKVWPSINHSIFSVRYLEGPVLVVEAGEGAGGGDDHNLGVRGQGQYRHSAQEAPVESCPTAVQYLEWPVLIVEAREGAGGGMIITLGSGGRESIDTAHKWPP